MDVKNAFLNDNLSEEFYTKPSPSYAHPLNKVCRLRRALYGLKEAPRAWFAKFSSMVHRFVFTPAHMIMRSLFDIPKMDMFSFYYTWMT